MALPLRTLVALALLVCSTTAGPTVIRAGGLEDELGRNEVRVRGAAYPLLAGRTVLEAGLPERLARLGYRRVRARPESPGEYFFGHESFWIYSRAHRWNGRDYAPSLSALELRREDGMILGATSDGGKRFPLDHEGLLWLEPETIAESLEGERAHRTPVDLERLPEHVWRSVLAAEDARFFAHAGVDARSVARAALSNVKEGRVAEGGSTITQQLIKNRDLSPKRSLGRKASEAVRALWLEAEYDKREILQAYLDQVYLGHVDGLALHGVGTAAQVYFSKPATELDLAESAALAAMIQGPNRLSPLRNSDWLRERRDWVLTRLGELEWVAADRVERARAAELIARPTPPKRRAPTQFVSWIADEVRAGAAERMEAGRGFVVETSLDPLLQQLAEETVRERLQSLRRDFPRLRGTTLSSVLIALDVRNGDVLAYVGGDPEARDGFDRGREAHRQPGSTVKPFVLLEAFDDCGTRKPLNPATRVADAPLRVDLPSGPWTPVNYDGRFRGNVSVRTSLAKSLNVPTVRVARWCGMTSTARRFARVGLDLPGEPPISFALGSVETTPLKLARAYTALATPGRMLEPRPLRRVEKPGGDLLLRRQPRSSKVARAASAYLVRDLMTSAVTSGTARVARVEGWNVAAKTGSTSDLRDAWFAGHAGSVLTLVWVGLDDGGRLGLTGAAAAGPIWRDFMKRAVPARPAHETKVPRNVVRRHVDPETGLLVRESNRRGREEVFRVGALPPRDRFWRVDESPPVVR